MDRRAECAKNEAFSGLPVDFVTWTPFEMQTAQNGMRPQRKEWQTACKLTLADPASLCSTTKVSGCLKTSLPLRSGADCRAGRPSRCTAELQ